MRYAEYDYDAGVITEYERLGKCTQCGDCCRALIRFTYTGTKPDATDNEKKGGGLTTDGAGKWQGYQDDSGQWRYVKLIECVPGDTACFKLCEDGRCGMYEDRNPYCQIWPLAPTDIAKFPKCGFSFKKTNEWPLEQPYIEVRNGI